MSRSGRLLPSNKLALRRFVQFVLGHGTLARSLFYYCTQNIKTRGIVVAASIKILLC